MSEKTKKIALVILTLIVSALLFYTYDTKVKSNTKEKQFIEEKRVVLEDFNQMKIKFDAAIAENTSLTSELIEQKKTMEDIESSLRNLKRSSSKSTNYYKKKLAEFTANSERLLRINDSLAQENSLLTNRNSNLNQENQNLYETKEALFKEQQVLKNEMKEKSTFNDTLLKQNLDLSKKVALAKIISTSNFSVTTLKERRSGKFKASQKARYVDVFKTSFRFNENLVAEKKDIKVNIAITTPSGSSLNKKGTFTNNKNEEIDFDEESIVLFNKKSIISDVIIKRKEDQKLEKGTYLVAIYINNKKIKTLKTNLR